MLTITTAPRSPRRVDVPESNRNKAPDQGEPDNRRGAHHAKPPRSGSARSAIHRSGKRTGRRGDREGSNADVLLLAVWRRTTPPSCGRQSAPEFNELSSLVASRVVLPQRTCFHDATGIWTRSGKVPPAREGQPCVSTGASSATDPLAYLQSCQITVRFKPKRWGATTGRWFTCSTVVPRMPTPSAWWGRPTSATE